jgi:hypothetical protein
VAPTTSAVESNDPGGPGGLVTFAGALAESVFGTPAPGAVVEPGAVVLPAAVASLPLVAAFAPESGGAAGADFGDIVSCAGG